jgi:hypothetical protein
VCTAARSHLLWEPILSQCLGPQQLICQIAYVCWYRFLL